MKVKICIEFSQLKVRDLFFIITFPILDLGWTTLSLPNITLSKSNIVLGLGCAKSSSRTYVQRLMYHNFKNLYTKSFTFKNVDVFFFFFFWWFDV